MATQNDYNIGLDTEKWFEETIKGQTRKIKLKHMGNAAFDFIGVINGTKFFLDVKFYKCEYRIPGWLEIEAWGKETGILSHSKQVKEKCFLAVLHKGMYHIINVKALQAAIRRGELVKKSGKSYDGGKECPIKFVIMNGFDDERFVLFSGKMDKDAWSRIDKTSSLKRMSIDKWFEGQFLEI